MHRAGVKSRTAAFFAAALAVIGPAALAQDRCAGSPAKLTYFGEWSKVSSLQVRLDGSKPHVIHQRRDARYLRAEIHPLGLGAEDWVLKVIDDKGRLVESIGPNAFKSGDGTPKQVFTARHETKVLLLILDDGPEQPAPEFRVPFLVVMPKGVTGPTYHSRRDPNVDGWRDLYRNVTNNPGIDYLGADSRTRWGDNVALLMVGLKAGQGPALCSGVALPPDLLLTNWHCGVVRNSSGDILIKQSWGEKICERTFIDLSWDTDRASRDFVCEDVVAKNPRLDYALLRISPLNGVDRIGSVKIALAEEGLGEAAIVHHPDAQRKRISEGCRVHRSQYDGWSSPAGSGPEGSRFLHDCDTSRGSSGAPVFDGKGNVIGLHHAGHEIDSSPSGCDSINKAIRIEFIINDIIDNVDNILGDLGDEEVTDNAAREALNAAREALLQLHATSP